MHALPSGVSAQVWTWAGPWARPCAGEAAVGRSSRLSASSQEKVSQKWKACHLNRANAKPKQDESLKDDEKREKEKLYAAHCEQLSIILTTIAKEQKFKAKKEYVKHLKHAARGSPRSEHLVHWLLNAGDRNKSARKSASF